MGTAAIHIDNAPDTTGISNVFIDEYMKDANDAQIKVYLYLVRMMSASQQTSIRDMADRFNHTETDVLRSLRYWEQRGLLCLDTDDAGNLCRIQLCTPQPPARISGEHQVISITSRLPDSTRRKPSSAEQTASSADSDPAVSGSAGITAARLESFRSRESSRQLLLVVEQYIGKPLSVPEVKSVCYISEVLHFSDELIDCLVDYCVSKGKRDFRYIEKVAQNWSREGVTTAGQAQTLLARSARRRSGTRRQSASDFRSIERNSYDFEELERRLLQQ